MSYPQQPPNGPHNPNQPPPPGYWQQQPPPPPQYGAPYVIPPKKINHGLHIVLCLVTFGLWLFAYLPIVIFSQKKSRIVYPDGRVEYR